jgi:hypothetical protein
MRVTISASGRGLRTDADVDVCCVFSRRGAGDHGPQGARMSSRPPPHTHFAHELLREIMVHGEGDDSGRDPSSRNGRLTVRGTPFLASTLFFFTAGKACRA